jgi:hypothetical protein
MIGLILNIITIIIVGIFVFFIYIAYRQRPEITITPMDVMRDIVGGQAGHSRLYKVVPTKRLLYGPMGEFGNYSNVDYSKLEGNMYDYKEGTRPWDGADNINLGSYTGVSRSEIEDIQEINTKKDILKEALENEPNPEKKKALQNLSQNDPEFYDKIAMIQEM